MLNVGPTIAPNCRVEIDKRDCELGVWLTGHRHSACDYGDGESPGAACPGFDVSFSLTQRYPADKVMIWRAMSCAYENSRVFRSSMSTHLDLERICDASPMKMLGNSDQAQ